MAVTWQTTTLSHGLRVVTTPVPTTQAATVNLFVGAGSRSEPQRLNGITHFLEHMIFKGTERRPRANMIAEEIEGAGGTLNAYTSKEYTCYWNIVPFDRLETAIDITADMLLHSTLSQEEIDRERTVVQQELKRNHDHPGAWASRLLGVSVYGEQPCGWDVGGSVELVGEMNRPDFMSHMEDWYLGPNMVLSVAGNCTHEQVLELAEPRFAEVAAGALPDITPYDPATCGARISIDSRDIDQCSVMLGLPLFGRSDPRRFAIRILNDILGSGMSSRLFNEVRERRGLAYSVSSGYGYLADAGVFTVSAGVGREKLSETIRVCPRRAPEAHRRARPRGRAAARQGPRHRPLPPFARDGLLSRPAPRRADPHEGQGRDDRRLRRRPRGGRRPPDPLRRHRHLRERPSPLRRRRPQPLRDEVANALSR